MVVHEDWDALGMRASGSNSISFEGVELPEHAVRGGFRAGDPLPYMERNLVAGLFHAAASLGVAESADAIARKGLAGRINGDGRPRMQVADNAVDLAAARRGLVAGGRADRRAARCGPSPGVERRRAGSAVRRVPGRQGVCRRGGARIVDRAMGLSGGAGYLNGSPLARAYRDVRAGAFMHPLGSNRLYDYLARVVLSEPSPLH